MKKWKLKLDDCNWGKEIHLLGTTGSDFLYYRLDSRVDFVIEPEVLSHIDSQKFSALKTKHDTLSDNLLLRIKAFNEKEDVFEKKWAGHRLLVRSRFGRPKVSDGELYAKNERQKYDDERQEYNDERQKYDDETDKLADECGELDTTQIKPELIAMHNAVISFSDYCINISDCLINISDFSDYGLNVSDNLWLYDGWVFKTTKKYEQEETQLLILEEVDKERRKFERLKAKFSGTRPDKLKGKRRERIPTKVRIEVWRRDNGQCVKCESRERLEYDHIIPVSKGGSSTARNIELLCEKCNREKSDKIE